MTATKSRIETLLAKFVAGRQTIIVRFPGFGGGDTVGRLTHQNADGSFQFVEGRGDGNAGSRSGCIWPADVSFVDCAEMNFIKMKD